MLHFGNIDDEAIELTEIDSTNSYALRLIENNNAHHGMLIRADYQTQGKGQHGNRWYAEERNNLLLSLILETKKYAIHNQFLLNMAAALAITQYLSSEINKDIVSIKWPNDIYVRNKKIAGILIENILRGNTWSYAIMGIGLNVNQTKFNELNGATSIQLEINKVLKLNAVQKKLVHSLRYYLTLFDKSSIQLLAAYNQQLLYVNQEIVFRKNYELYKGTLLGVDEMGRIEIQYDGKKKLFQHKEITLILP